MQPGLGGASHLPEERIAEAALRSGKVTLDQIAEAGGLISKMRQLGVERDLLGALVDRKALTAEDAEEIRKLVAQGVGLLEKHHVVQRAEPVAASETALHEKIDLAVEEAVPIAEPVDDDEGRSCANHPQLTAVATCTHCSKPICSKCIVRTDQGAFCSQTCMLGWQQELAAKFQSRAAQTTKALRLGRLMLLAGIVAVVLGLGWAVKYLVDDYRFASWLNRSQRKDVTLKERVALLRKAVSVRPGDAAARLAFGKALIETGEVGRATEELSAALERDAENGEALQAIADAYMAKRKYDEAASALERLRKLGISTYDVNRQLGLVYVEHLDRPEDATSAFRSALKAGGESRELRYMMGRALLDMGRISEARAELKRAVAPVAKEEGATVSREQAFLANGQRVAGVHATLATIAEKENDVEAVLDHLKQAQRADPANVTVLNRRVDILLAGGKLHDALKAAKAAWRHLSGKPKYLVLLSGLQEEAGMVDDRLATLRKLHRAAPDTPGVLEDLAEAEATVGAPSAARKLLDSVPGQGRYAERFANAWAAIVASDLAKGRFEEAERVLKKLGPTAETDARFATLWCDVLHRLGRDAEALDRAKTAIERAPKDPMAYLVVGTVYRTLGLMREAFENTEKAVKLGAGGTAEFQLAMMLWRAGFPEEAAKRLDAAKADRKLPTRLRARVDLCLSCLRGGELQPDPSGSAEGELARNMTRAWTSTDDLFRQIHIGTYGIGRMCSIIAGTAKRTPTSEELARIRRISSARRPTGQDIVTALRKELALCVRSFAQAAGVMARGAKAEADRALAVYIAQIAQVSSTDALGHISAAAGAQLRMMEAVLRTHPRGNELAARLRTINERMRVRRAISAGVMQSAVAADYAVAEMLAALIDVGPAGFVFRAPVANVFTDTAGVDAASTDALTQFRAARAACYRMLYILSRQLQQMKGMEGGAS